MKRILTLCLLLAAFTIAASADVPSPDQRQKNPKQKKTIDSHLTIRLDENAKEAKLIIPKSQLGALRAGLDEDEGRAAFLSFSRTQTIVSGLFLSLAFVFGGVWLSRSQKSGGAKNNKTLAAVTVLFAAGTAAATIALANVGPPPESRKVTGKLFNKKLFYPYLAAGGKIKIEISDEAGDGLELIVPDQKEETRTNEE